MCALRCAWFVALATVQAAIAEPRSGFVAEVVQPSAAELYDAATPALKTFTTSDGLPDNTVEGLAYDRTGHLWIGTQDGAAVYLGHSWKPITFPGTKPSRLVHAVLAASDGSIWFGTSGSGVFRLKNNQWSSYDASSGLPSSEVFCIGETNENNRPVIWIGTRNGLAKIKDGALRTVQRSGPPAVNTITALVTDESTGDLWVGSENGLGRIVRGSDSYAESVRLSGRMIRSLLVERGDGDHNILWVGTNDGLVSYQGEAASDVSLGSNIKPQVIGLTQSHESDGSATLWVGIRGVGFGRLHKGEWKQFGKQEGLADENVIALASGTSGGRNLIWVGGDGGLVRLAERGWFSFPSGPAVLRGKATSLLESKDGSIWMATELGLGRFNRDHWTIYRPPASRAQDVVVSLVETTIDNELRVVAGTAQGNIFQLKAEEWELLANLDPGNNIARALLSVVETDGSTSLWVGLQRGLFRLKNGEVTHYDTTSGLPSDWILSLGVTYGPSLTPTVWVGTYGGLSRFHAGQWETESSHTGLPHDVASAIATTNDSTLWVGTPAGVGRLKLTAKTHNWEIFSDRSDPAVRGVVYQVRSDAQGRIYFFTNKGVSRLTLGKEGNPTVTSFGQEDGLPNVECVYAGALIDRRGRIWAATNGGVAVFDPTTELQHPEPAPLELDRILVNRIERPGDQLVSLRHDENEITFEYSLLSYFRDSDTRYRTQLVGADRLPTDWGTDHKREFSTLPAGHYEFHIWAKNYAGIVSWSGAQHFEIRRAPWLTPWAFFLYGTILTVAAYSMFRYRTRELHRRAEMLEQTVADRTREVEEKRREVEAKNAALAASNDELEERNVELVESYKQADRIFSALADALSGTTLDGKFRLDEKIGEGGFGAVFKATQIAGGPPVAVKVFRPQAGNASAESLERFRQEGVSASRVAHKNAVNILDSGISAEGIAYLVMELLEGRSLSAELKQLGKLSIRRAGQIASSVLKALAVAHQSGIVHRDIKPDNIFIHHDADGEIIKVVDFGVAKLRDQETKDKTLTVTGAIVGTPAYMAPERLESRPYDGRSDVYSVGIVLYEMLTGEPPFQSQENNIWSLVMMHLTVAPRALSELDPTIPPEVAQVVLEALAKNQEERPDAATLIGRIEQSFGLTQG